ncbi:MAG: zinc-binding dehydrogenase [Rhizobiaceae bacterium]
MKAVVLRQNGDPSVLKLEDWPEPVAGPGEVIVKVGAVGVPYHDIVERNGTLRPGHGLPKVLGNEIAGTVMELGAEVRSLKVGDRVCATGFHTCGRCRYCRTGRETACPHRKVVTGGYAERVAVAADALVPIPDSLDFATACMLGSSTAVALGALRDIAQVRLGETVLVTGASGGVGLPAVEIAKSAGARAIGVTRSPSKVDAIREAGADEVVIAPDGSDFSKDVRALTEGVGADVVVDTVGSRVFTAAFKSLAITGRYIVIGQLFRETIQLNPAHILFKCAAIHGVTNARRDQLADTVRLVAGGRIKPRVAATMSLAKAAEAHAMVEAGSVVGRVVLLP